MKKKRITRHYERSEAIHFLALMRRSYGLLRFARNDVLKLFAVFFSLSCQIHAQEIGAPLDIPLYLSGNFGELRSDHFHSGLDFKTQGITGFPVRAIKAGYISRISVGPFGFGRAIYINHTDGTTSVYGHLERFVPKIEAGVIENQYRNESFTVNLFPSVREFPVKQGEVIAYSGNTGSSGGPHLHIELRNTTTEKPFDPLPVFKNYLKDSRPPEIRSLLFVPQTGKGIVNGSAGKQIMEVIKNKSGKYTLSKPVKAWGLIGIGIKAFDKMDAVPNIYGVKEIRLLVNEKEIYHSILDAFSFDESRYLNSFIDWEEWIKHKSFFMKSFIDPGNKLGIYRTESNGLISIQETKTYACTYLLKDAFGNTSTFNFSIIGEKQSIPEEKKKGVLFSFNRDNEYKGKGISLNIPKGNLYTDVYLNPDTIYFKTNKVQNPNPNRVISEYAPLYSFGEQVPLFNSCLLTLTITNDSYPDKSKYGIVSVENNRVVWLGGEYEFGKMKIQIREIGSYTIVIDTLPPLVAPVNQVGWTANQCISFKISDDLSGIDFYRGELDGKFALFEYDAKSRLLFCNFDTSRMKKGKQSLTLIVRDGAKNETAVSYDVDF